MTGDGATGDRPHRYRPEIDGLRAVAVVPVVLFHAGVAGFSGGYVGVDVFFVISGFLITQIILSEIERGRFTVIGFYERRARRILPALFFVLAAVAVIGWVIITPVQYVGLLKNVVSTTLFAANVHSFLTVDYFATAAEFRPLLHTWSLAVEEQFYLFWPLLLVALSRRRRWMIAATLAIVVVSLAISAVVTHLHPPAGFYLLPARAWELLAGAILAAGLVPVWRHPRAAGAAAAIGMGMIIAPVSLFDSETLFPGVAALLPCVGTCLVIHSGGGTAVGRALSWPPIVGIGLVSYSFYLWHWPLLAFARIVNGSVELASETAATAVLLSFALAVLSWRFIEQPFRRRDTFGRTRIFAISGAGMAVAIAGSVAVVATDGAPGRFSGPFAAVALGSADLDPQRDLCRTRTALGELCTLGAPGGEPRVLLWGDSHAGALKPAIDSLLHKAGRSGAFATRAGCPPLVGIIPIDHAPSCRHLNEAAMALVEDPASTIGTVILAARWPLAYSGERSDGEGGRPLRLRAIDGAQAPQPELVRRALAETVGRLRRAGAAVVLLGSVPEIGWNVPVTATARLQLSLPLPAIPLIDEVERRTEGPEALLAEAAAAPGMHYLPLAPLLCDPDCAVIEKGRAVYSDDDHLSQFGAIEVLAPRLSDRLLPILTSERAAMRTTAPAAQVP